MTAKAARASRWTVTASTLPSGPSATSPTPGRRPEAAVALGSVASADRSWIGSAVAVLFSMC